MQECCFHSTFIFSSQASMKVFKEELTDDCATQSNGYIRNFKEGVYYKSWDINGSTNYKG